MTKGFVIERKLVFIENLCFYHEFNQKNLPRNHYCYYNIFQAAKFKKKMGYNLYGTFKCMNTVRGHRGCILYLVQCFASSLIDLLCNILFHMPPCFVRKQ